MSELHDARAAKPAFGVECNGCGLCCLMEPCSLAEEFLDVSSGRCPALEWEEGRFWCGLVRSPSKYLAPGKEFADAVVGAAFAQALGVGVGCDAHYGASS